MQFTIPSEFDSKFRFILVVAERAKQLLNGAPAKLEAKEKKPHSIAIREVENRLIEYQILDPEEEPEESEEPILEES